MLIRTETDDDHSAVHAIYSACFPTTAEAKLVDRLRKYAQPHISLVATEHDTVVGHILFTPVTLTTSTELLMGLAPMAVKPDSQGQGIGSALVRGGLQQCREIGAGAVFVLGHADFYPRFGFEPTAPGGIVCEYDIPADHFMLLRLNSNALEGRTGTVSYHQEFANL